MTITRPYVHGRSIRLGERALPVRGVTYGTFRPLFGTPFPPARVVQRDFEQMAAAGVNAVRTYEPPPAWLLDRAAATGLRVMVGLAWTQHVAFLDDRRAARRIAAEVAAQVRACGRHPAILCYALGNEIPAPIARWHGKRRMEAFLERLHWEAKGADPEGLFTYVNYPSTEYLHLPFLDLSAFNVFLEDAATYESYLARLQNLSPDRPLLIAELGLDSRRHGEAAQAETVESQVRAAFATGAAGAFVFSWTDEWHRGGHDVVDWSFGLVDRERRPKAALAAARRAFSEVPFRRDDRWPRVSVVVCTHNGEATLDECLAGVARLDYPDFETIVVDDGSHDRSAEIARRHGATVLRTEHRGLSHARNSGVARASGEIVAFLDDDAHPDEHWLQHLAAALRDPRRAGVGGPNLPPPDEGLTAECVAAAPGGPTHVLTSDRDAEHLPGCNMAFRKGALEAVGGFDERFRVAGDDVDICWRLQEAGWTLGFSAGAVVLHRRRGSVRRYLRQQYGYGRAEALLERKWPERYSQGGSSRWAGRIYDAPAALSGGRRPRVRYGRWGSGLFQSIYDGAGAGGSGLAASPESLLLIATLAVVLPAGLLWAPFLVTAPAVAMGLLVVLGRAAVAGWQGVAAAPGRSRPETLARRGLTTALFVLQPLARLAGRLRSGLSPWRRRHRRGLAWPLPRTARIWGERWREPDAWLGSICASVAAAGGFLRSGGAYDRWDLDIRSGPLGAVRIRTAVEEHGSGRQLVRIRAWPRLAPRLVLALTLLGLLSALAWLSGEPALGATTATGLLAAVALALEGSAAAMGLLLSQLRALQEREAAPVDEAEAQAPAADTTFRLRPLPLRRRSPALARAELEEARR